jgi:hypothetical protein
MVIFQKKGSKKTPHLGRGGGDKNKTLNEIFNRISFIKNTVLVLLIQGRYFILTFIYYFNS